MITKWLLLTSSSVLGLAGLSALFAPRELAVAFGLPPTAVAPVLFQLLGALYGSVALMNWTAKDSRIGGIYLRPVSLGNFAHFTIGALTLLRPAVSPGLSWLVLVAFVVYALFALAFGWLVFFASGRPTTSVGPPTSSPH